jgi:hypothetical protein
MGLAAGCSSSGSSGPAASTQVGSVEVSQQVAPPPVASSVAPEPTGVPGLAAADPFCAAWAGYVGTVQALGIAASFGQLASDRLAALELVAAPYLVAVTATIAASWPAELAADASVRTPAEERGVSRHSSPRASRRQTSRR